MQWTNQTKGNGSEGITVPSVLSGQVVYLPIARVLLVMGGQDVSVLRDPGALAGPQLADSTTDLAQRKSMAQAGTGMIFRSIRSQSTISHQVPGMSSANHKKHSWLIRSVSRFSTQAAGVCGSIPSNRGDLGSRAPDDSSFQITLFGGWSLFAEQANEEVWVLTVPSFNGSKSMRQTLVPSPKEWADPNINVYGQMLVLGGVIHENTNITVCDPLFPPLKVLDTSEYAWKSTFDASLQYTVPSAVSAVIGGR